LETVEWYARRIFMNEKRNSGSHAELRIQVKMQVEFDHTAFSTVSRMKASLLRASLNSNGLGVDQLASDSLK
jgi:hypothetical protein